MSTFFIKLIQLLLSLSLLVALHELGHLFFARLFKIRVEKYRIFFDPWFSIFSWKSKRSGTDWGIGWLPLGGYVKIAGMVDESMDTEQMKAPVKEDEFRAKPAWQRLCVMVGGVFANLVVAAFIYIGVLYVWGESYIEPQKAPAGMVFSQVGKNAGFQDGDTLLSIDNEFIERLDGGTIRKITNAREVTVLRSGQEVAVYIPGNLMEQMLESHTILFDYRYPSVADTVIIGSLADRIGMVKGDRIVSINGQLTPTYDMLKDVLAEESADSAHSVNNKLAIEISYIHGMETISRQDSIILPAGIIGISHGTDLFAIKEVKYGFLESIPAGIRYGSDTLVGYVKDLKYLFTKAGVSSVGGFGTIASIFPATWNWYLFWMRTALISVMLAVMNLLPIPGLDGGHVLFLSYEWITGRKPSDKFLEYATMIGLVSLLLLVVYANVNDIIKFLF
ncbi:MAG: RIP metalloprotease RseP [Bacteroidaceae bacterium]